MWNCWRPLPAHAARSCVSGGCGWEIHSSVVVVARDTCCWHSPVCRMRSHRVRIRRQWWRRATRDNENTPRASKAYYYNTVVWFLTVTCNYCVVHVHTPKPRDRTSFFHQGPLLRWTGGSWGLPFESSMSSFPDANVYVYHTHLYSHKNPQKYPLTGTLPVLYSEAQM